MALKYTVDDAQKMIFVDGSGTVTGQDILATQTEVNEPDFKGRSYNRLIDFRDVDSFQVSSQEASQIAWNSEKNDAFEKVALVVSKEFHYGLGRMISERGLSDRVEVFRIMVGARKWLGLPPM
jgi:hypothetical protein